MRFSIGRCATYPCLLAILFSSLAAPPGAAQNPVTPPVPQWPNLLYVRLAGPAGMKVTLFHAGAPGQTFDTPVAIGLRPGYRFRVLLSDIPGHPNLTLAPTLEVRGSLKFANRARSADFPVGIAFDEDDFAVVEAGALVTKVAVLEPPDQALPEASRADRPLQINLVGNRDPVGEASAHGRPVLVLYLGPRQMTPDELAAQAINGTLLPPGQKDLGPPALPPNVPYAWIPPHDPVLGPRDPNEEMKLWDGGDRGLPAGFGLEGNLRGVGPADTVAEYTDNQGRRRIVHSNRVGICVPRFLILRGQRQLGTETATRGPGTTFVARGREVFDSRQPALTQSGVFQPEAAGARRRASETERTLGPLLGERITGQVIAEGRLPFIRLDAMLRGELFESRQPFAEQHQHVQLEGINTRLPASGAERTLGTAVTGRLNGIDVVATLRPTATIIGTCPPALALEPPDGPLKIDKWPDKCNGVIGDLITFFIRFTNTGRQSMTGIAVTDSLIGRFEYVPGTAQTDRDTTFTTQPNETGSLILRWEFSAPLPPGESGLVSFQIKIR